MSFTIRQADANDLEMLVVLFDGYRQFYGQPSDPARARAFLAARLAGMDSVILIAEADGAAQGFAQLYPSFSSVRTGRLWILNDLFVARASRQRGAGRALLAACVAHAEQTGAMGLKLETEHTNTVAQALYIEQGWEPDETFCSYVYPLEPRA